MISIDISILLWTAHLEGANNPSDVQASLDPAKFSVGQDLLLENLIWLCKSEPRLIGSVLTNRLILKRFYSVLDVLLYNSYGPFWIL